MNYARQRTVRPSKAEQLGWIYQLIATDLHGNLMVDPMAHFEPIGEGEKTRFTKVCRQSGFHPVEVASRTIQVVT